MQNQFIPLLDLLDCLWESQNIQSRKALGDTWSSIILQVGRRENNVSEVVLPTNGMELRPFNHWSVFLLNSIYQTFIVYLMCAL